MLGCTARSGGRAVRRCQSFHIDEATVCRPLVDVLVNYSWSSGVRLHAL